MTAEPSPRPRRLAGDLTGLLLVTGLMVAAAGLGGASGDFNSRWYKRLKKPGFQPPGQTIGAVWSVLYMLTTATGFLLWLVPQAAKHGSIER